MKKEPIGGMSIYTVNVARKLKLGGNKYEKHNKYANRS